MIQYEYWRTATEVLSGAWNVGRVRAFRTIVVVVVVIVAVVAILAFRAAREFTVDRGTGVPTFDKIRRLLREQALIAIYRKHTRSYSNLPLTHRSQI